MSPTVSCATAPPRLAALPPPSPPPGVSAARRSGDSARRGEAERLRLPGTSKGEARSGVGLSSSVSPFEPPPPPAKGLRMRAPPCPPPLRGARLQAAPGVVRRRRRAPHLDVEGRRRVQRADLRHRHGENGDRRLAAQPHQLPPRAHQQYREICAASEESRLLGS